MATKKKSASKSKAKAAKKKVVRKVASKLSSKKASTSTRKAPAKKAVVKKSTKKVAKTKVAKSTKKSATKTKKKVAVKKATKRVRASSKKAQAQVIPPNAIPCFKVLAQRDGKLQSIFARGDLRLDYEQGKYVEAPHESLPITAFQYKSDAERFMQRNSRRRVAPWIIVEGKGVQVPAPRSRVAKISDFTSLGESQVERILSITQQAPPPLRNRWFSGWRNKYVSRNWARGTIFVSGFAIN